MHHGNTNARELSTHRSLLFVVTPTDFLMTDSDFFLLNSALLKPYNFVCYLHKDATLDIDLSCVRLNQSMPSVLKLKRIELSNMIIH